METLRIYYDGDCVFCTNYVRMLRLKAIFKSVELYSIREDLVAARRLTDEGPGLPRGSGRGLVVQGGPTRRRP